VKEIVYSKATQTAIAALSRLAELYDGGITCLSADEIATARNLQRPFLGKVLTALSAAGIIAGTRGPGGGYTFAVPPQQVTLHDVYVLFDRERSSDRCPVGGGICGNDDKCPLHDRFAEVRRATDRVLHETTFDAFRQAYQQQTKPPQWQFTAT
jgi:Rrf2 family protein